MDRARSPRRTSDEQTHREDAEDTPTQVMTFVLVIAGVPSPGGVPSPEEGRAVRRPRATRWSIWHPSRETIQPWDLRRTPRGGHPPHAVRAQPDQAPAAVRLDGAGRTGQFAGNPDGVPPGAEVGAGTRRRFVGFGHRADAVTVVHERATQRSSQTVIYFGA